MKVIVFQLKDEEYAIEVDYIQSIERMQPVTRIPSTYPFVTGVMNLRGVITPIINLRKRFGIEEKGLDEATRILVIQKGDIEIGFIVDGANDVIDIPVDKIEPTPEVVGGVEAEYLRGVVKLNKRLFTLLNLEKVIQES
ncbi:chemotaxis protein CheW [Alkalihalophilus pseudofirmus]|nr:MULTISPECIES: chemotaxis protein CheW [Alkalihalophilus]MDV2885750.1 chemotaxis protein CheW [Alkalihalophilus pseudofirmus]MEC2071559.1 chemotaxis protein CheW [Alkalihalophilus marmarensis]MED1600933.1 chemotaxis protein CheW [Alkalihalophilus marmarensis]OLS39835.1 chemotaxis protein CheW [Alkalihalophilus pseudofirmus]